MTATKEVKNVTKTVEKKAVEKFDFKAYAAGIVDAFAKDASVDVVADTDLEQSRCLSVPEYSYLHFFRKGTTKDMFKMYNSGKNTIICISRAAYESGKIADATPTVKTNKKTGEKFISCANIKISHEDAVNRAKEVISIYQELPVKVKAEKPAKAEKKPAEKKTTAKTATKKTEKKVVNK